MGLAESTPAMTGASKPTGSSASAKPPSESTNWARIGAIVGVTILALAVIGTFGGLFWRIADTKTDLTEKINNNAVAIGELKGKLDGLAGQVKSMDGKLDAALNRASDEAPPADPPVKHSQRR